MFFSTSRIIHTKKFVNVNRLAGHFSSTSQIKHTAPTYSETKTIIYEIYDPNDLLKFDSTTDEYLKKGYIPNGSDKIFEYQKGIFLKRNFFVVYRSLYLPNLLNQNSQLNPNTDSE
jgi:hypothetical protein